jgi:hypothetical protein
MMVVATIALGLVAWVFLRGRGPSHGAPGERLTREGMLADAARYLDDPAFRRAELERSLTNPENTYSKERLRYYGLAVKGWDLLPEWNPRSAVVRGAPDERALRESRPLWDGARPSSYEAWLALGREVFFRYPLRTDAVARFAVERPDEAARLGVVRLQDGSAPGLVHFVDVDGAPALGITCALCHTALDGATLVVGEARRSLDYGAARLAYAAMGRGPVEAELARRMRMWGPGRADVTEDDDEDPVAIPDLFGLRHQAYLTQAGTIRHTGLAALALRQETQLLTSNHQRVRPPRVLAVALAMFVESLEVPSEAPRDHPGRPLFEQQCARCHASPVRGGDLVSSVTVGTDSALSMGKARGTGYLRTPALVHVKRGAPFLHHGAVRSIDELLSPERLAPGYHRGVNGDGPVPGHTYGTDLSSADRASLAAYVEAL